MSSEELWVGIWSTLTSILGRLTSLSWCHLIPVPDQFSRAGQKYQAGRWVVLTKDNDIPTRLALLCSVYPSVPNLPIYNRLR